MPHPPAHRYTFAERMFRTRSDWYQSNIVDELQDQADSTESRVDKLMRTVTAQTAQLEQLSATVVALVELLAETTGLDAHALGERIDAAVEESRKAAAERKTITCTRCQREVMPQQTIMTAEGPVCDPNCAAVAARGSAG